MVRSMEEIVKATGITENDRFSLKLASKYYRIMVMDMSVFTEHSETKISSDATRQDLDPSSTNKNTLSPLSQSTSPIPVKLAIDQYISKLANTAKIGTKVERLAIDIAHKTDDHLLADGKAPNGLGAANISSSCMTWNKSSSS